MKKTLLEKEIGKAVFAAKHAYNHGYVEAVKERMGLGFDSRKAKEFRRTRCRYLDNVHPLAQNGFSARIGHYDHNSKRNDWKAVSRDVANLHFGAVDWHDSFSEVLSDATWLHAKEHVKIKDNVGEFNWPFVLSNGFAGGVLPQTARLFNPKEPISVSSERKGRNVLLSFQGKKRIWTSKQRKTLALIKQIAEHFKGMVKTSKKFSNLKIHITLPFKIRVDGFTGGHFTKDEIKKMQKRK